MQSLIDISNHIRNVNISICVSALCTPCITLASCWCVLDCTVRGHCVLGQPSPSERIRANLYHFARETEPTAWTVQAAWTVRSYACFACPGGRMQKSASISGSPRHPHARASLYHFARTARSAKTARATRTNYADGTDSMDCTRLLSHCHHTAYGDCSLPCRCSLQDCPLQTFIACLLKLPHFLQYQSLPTMKSWSRGALHLFLLQNPRCRQL